MAGGFKKQLDLIIQLTITSFKLRNEGSYLGAFWYILNPILMFLVLFFVFSRNLGKGIEYYPLYLLIGLIQWNFMNVAMSSSMNNLLDRGYLIKSINFSKSSLMVSSVVMALLTHLIEILVLIIFLLFSGINIKLIILLPIIIMLQFIFLLGLSFTFSTLIVYVRDLDNIWDFFQRVWWFLTPIFYKVEEGTLLYTLNLINPMYYIISSTREIILYQNIPFVKMLIISVFSFLAFLIGFLIYASFYKKITDNI